MQVRYGPHVTLANAAARKALKGNTARPAKTSRAKAWRVPFLEHLSVTCNVSQSCIVAKINRHTAYEQRGNDEEFRKQWDAAIDDALDDLEGVAYDVASSGDRDMLKFYLTKRRPKLWNPVTDVTLGLQPGERLRIQVNLMEPLDDDGSDTDKDTDP